MDPFLLTVWIVRLLFLALLYLFLFRIVRALLRDLRAAAREPGAELGRLVVVELAERRAGGGHVVRARRDHDARPRRQQRDRRRGPVRLGRARGPDLPRPGLVRRGPRQHERHVRQRRAGRGRRAARVRRRAPDRPGPAPARAAAPRRARRDDAPAAPEPAARSSARSGRGRAGARRGCSLIVAVALVVGSVSLGLTARSPTRRVARPAPRRTRSTCAIYLGLCSAAHLAQVLPAGGRTRSCCRRSAMLGGISLLLMERLPQDLVDAVVASARARARRQSSWSGCSCRSPGHHDARGIVVRSRSLAAPLQVHLGGRRRRAPAARPSSSATTSTASA